ncbi:MAG TPA: chaperone modulator CbpM [Thermomicrobiales bacterium]|nr:chaperone modulator CbpM [Thermomicrobiales bacterium]
MANQINDRQFYRIEAAAQIVGLPPARVRRYVRAGLIQPAARERGAIVLGEDELTQLRRIRRLTLDLGLNMAGLEVVLRLLDEMTQLQVELEQARTATRGRR